MRSTIRRRRADHQLTWSRMTVPAALHPFVILAKSATGAACADLIKQATSANGAYTFTALLEAENVQKLAGTEHEPSLNLLRIFSWGTYRDYTSINLAFHLFTY